MLELIAEAEFRCTMQELTAALQDLDVIYTLYCPNEHIVCKYLKGNPITPGSVLFFQEYIAGKKQTMKYQVHSVDQHEKSTVVTFKAMFPRSLLNIRAIFRMSETEDGVLFSRTIRLGDYKSPLLSKLIEKLALFTLGGKYYSEMIEHNQDDLQKLKEYIETAN